jgi:hypothetical protein
VNEVAKVLLFNETRGGSGRPGWPGVAVAFLWS